MFARRSDGTRLRDRPAARDAAATILFAVPSAIGVFFAILSAIGGAVLLAPAPLAAQTLHDQTITDQVRTIPGNTRLGRLRIDVFPEATIDRKPVRFTAGARIYDRGNLIVPPATLTEPVDVLYRLDAQGQVDAAWVLTADELAAAKRRK